MHYADTSALVKLIVEEPGSSAMDDLASAVQLVASALVRVELRRALAPQGRAALDESDLLLARLQIVRIDDDLLDAAGRLAGPSLRSLDAIHLATALLLGDELDALVTYDRRLGEAAADHGIAVLAPA